MRKPPQFKIDEVLSYFDTCDIQERQSSGRYGGPINNVFDYLLKQGAIEKLSEKSFRGSIQYKIIKNN